MEYFLGIDIGTSSTKAVAFSAKGEVLGSYAIAYPMLHPGPDRSEQDPELIFQAVIGCIKKISGQMIAVSPVFISFSAAMHSLIIMDSNGRAITPCIIWADNRAGDAATALRNSEWGQYCYQATGVPVHAMSPLCKLIWFREHQKEIFNRASFFIGIKEYVFFRLFGTYISDSAVASATGLLSLANLQWDPEILDRIGIKKNQLPQLVSPKYIVDIPLRPEILIELKSLEHTKFIIGASDGALANLGTGATSQDTMAVTIGTSSAARVVISEPYIDPGQRSFCYHFKDGYYLLGGAGNNGAVVLQWLKESVLKNNSPYESLFQEAASVEPGASGLLFIPYILGERAPVWDSKARGILFGLGIDHNQATIIRATLEGITYALYSFGSILSGRLPVKEIRASGGFTQSPLWLQMLADVFNIPVTVSGREDSSAWGAVLLGMEALGMSIPGENERRQRYEPVAARHGVYMEAYNRFARIYALCNKEWKMQ